MTKRGRLPKSLAHEQTKSGTGRHEPPPLSSCHPKQTPPPSLLRLTEAAAILLRVDEAEDERAVVARLNTRRAVGDDVDPSVPTCGFWITTQITEVLHRDEAAIDEVLDNLLTLKERTQSLARRMNAGVHVCDELRVVC